MLEVNYFFLGRLARKNGSPLKAISAFKTALQLIEGKMKLKSVRGEEARPFWDNLRVKIYYKMSKCHREMGETTSQINFQDKALHEAARIGNKKLEYYIRRKVQFYEAKVRFRERLNKLESKRRIQEEVTKLIEESRQTQIKSLYFVYNFQSVR